jgi:hypothetical protein
LWYRYTVIENILDFRTPDIGLAYIYFEHQQARSIKPNNYIADLVRQFEEQKEGLSTSVRSKYDKLPSKSQLKPDLQTAKEFLLDSVESFPSGAYIILDGFDECKEDGRRALVDCLRSFNSRDKRFRFFIASRPNSSVDLLASKFGDQARRIEISAGQGDVNGDLKQYVESKLLDVEEELEDGERLFIAEQIIAKAQGL